MKNHLSRTLLIWGVIIAAVVNIYPTVGWLALSDEARQARMDKWQKEDDEYAKKRSTATQDIYRSVKRWAEFDRDRVMNLGLDLQGGVHMVLTFDIKDLGEQKLKEMRDQGMKDADIQKQVQDTVLEQITRRVNEFEAKEPVIQSLGTNQIQVQLPGEKNVERAQKLITKVAQLNFHIVASFQDETLPFFEKLHDKYPGDYQAFILRPSSTRGGEFRCKVENYERVARMFKQAEDDKLVPEGKRLAFGPKPKPYEDQEYKLYLLDSTPIMTGEGMTRAGAAPDERHPPYWQIQFGFDSTHGEKFGEVTENNTGKQMAIVVDNVVVSAPTIQSKITTSGQITGNFDGPEARDLVIALNSGAMTVPVHEDYTGVVGASLGRDSVNKGVLSGLLGVIAIAIFVLFYYTTAGGIAVVGLLVNALLTIAAMTYFGMTLTLPGIAGLILSIGMAVDANVLIYERMREEFNLGHTLSSSVGAAFNRAGITIIDTNSTTLIAAAVLYQFGTGPIQGFAITLFIGVLVSLFTALVVTRGIFDFLIENGWLKRIHMFHVIPTTLNIPFMSYRRIFIPITTALAIAGVAYFAYRGKENLGVDFTQGTNINLTISAKANVPEGDIRSALEQAGFTEPSVQRTSKTANSDGNDFLVRVPESARAKQAQNPGEQAAADKTVAQRIQDVLAPLTDAKSADGVVLNQVQTVGPAAGAQLRLDALSAAFWAIAFITIYVAWRFELRFAAGAVISLLHDVLITIGVMALLQRQFTMTGVAAILTIIGYSLNDTIVVFDRIREDLKLYRGKGYKLEQLIDIAVNATLSRTILTSLLTLFVCIVLFFFGGETLNDFALILIIGIITGTYSSIFIASPFMHLWTQLFVKKTEIESEAAPSGDPNPRRRRRAQGGAKNATA